MQNICLATTEGFGFKWSALNRQAADLSTEERQYFFNQHLGILPRDGLPKDAIRLDAGSGKGRRYVLALLRIDRLHLLDASSDALEAAATYAGVA